MSLYNPPTHCHYITPHTQCHCITPHTLSLYNPATYRVNLVLCRFKLMNLSTLLYWPVSVMRYDL